MRIQPAALVLAALVLPAYTVVGNPDALEHHQAGVAFHVMRSLDEASHEYDETLALDPAQDPTPEERARVLRLAPRVFVTDQEPFALRDAAAIVHPSRRVIAYHLFWEDDVDFPDDNDPCDHEVVWVEYDSTDAVRAVRTLFHGRVIDGGNAANADAHANRMRPRVNVQWGKHGPLPASWERLTIETEESDADTGIPPGRTMTLLEYATLSWRKLSTEGTRGRNHPLAIRYGWPRRFDGSLEAFSSFRREEDIRPLLERHTMMLVSRWNSASLARRLLFYNFRPKLEWPE